MGLEQMLHMDFKYQYINFWQNIYGRHLEDALHDRGIPLLNIYINTNGIHGAWKSNTTYITELLLVYSKLKTQNSTTDKDIEEYVNSASKLHWLNAVWANITKAFKSTEIAVFPNSNEVAMQIYFRA